MSTQACDARSPRVTIIIPCYGREDYALEAAKSALAQDYPNLEVLFVDDASPDTHFATVAALKDPRLRMVRNPCNLGRAANYRHALYALATGEWALVLDGDDYLTDAAFISEAVRRGASDPSIVMVAGRALTLSARGLKLSPSPGEVVMDGLSLLQQLPKSELFLMHLATLYRRRPALEVDFYRVPHLSSDWESLYRLAATGRVAFIDRVAGVWRIHGENATAQPDPVALARNLDIWPSIFVWAQSAGLPHHAARVACRACIVYFLRDHLPSLLRGRHRLQTLLQYCSALAPESRKALFSALASPYALARLSLGLLGYYRRRQF
jgi:glycosyltransferase involved in cell wall biosynthesis